MATASLDHQNQNQNHHCKSHHHSSPFDVDLGSSPIPPRRLRLDRKDKLPHISTNEALISRSCVVGVKSQTEGGEAPADSLWLALHKFLASKKEEECNWPVVDTYSCDDFRMYEFKVRKCMRGRSHDWTECPFAHPGEKARRRDPRRFHYSGTVCPDFRKGSCRRGDACEFAHGVFECWLHPARYRTQPCKDGRNCKRKVCFFAHTPQQLRVLPILQNGPSPRPTASCNGFYLRYPSENSDSTTLNISCPLCYPRSNHFPFVCKASRVPPPISTLRASCHVSPSLSPPVSPPISPVSLNDFSVKNIQNKTKGFSAEYSPICSHQTTMAGNSLNNHPSGTNLLGYQNLVAELVNSLEAIDLVSINNHPGWGPSTENDQNSPLFFPGLSFSADSAPCHVDEQYGVQHPHSDSFFSGEKTTANSGSSNFYSPDLEWIKELVM